MVTRKLKHDPADAIACSQCVYFKHDDPKDDIGECRRNPPVAYFDEDDAGYSFPVVPPNEWCGEFKRKAH